MQNIKVINPEKNSNIYANKSNNKERRNYISNPYLSSHLCVFTSISVSLFMTYKEIYQ